MFEINGINVPFIPIEQKTAKNVNEVKTGENFESIFQQELNKVKFSNHAIKRLEERNINISNSEMLKINTAIERAESKGSKDSLVMMNSTAFIVNIPNKTVITALPVDGYNENVFTNIDSVVFV